jgi:LacI family transcriptional regulator
MDATLLDVARRARVSEATASRVLNRRRYVAPATRARVEQAALELDYVPNQAARELSTAQTTTIVLLVHHSQYPADGEGTFSSRVVDAISRHLREHGYDLLYVPVDDTGARDLARLGPIRPGRAGGIIVLGPAFPRPSLRALAATGRAMTLVDNRLPGVDAVLADNRSGMRALARHLLDDHGYQSLACLAGPAAWPSSSERLAGIRDVAEPSGVRVHVLRARETTLRDGAQLAAHVQALRPDAVMAVNDALAVGVLHGMRSAGAGRLPTTGFDDVAWAALVEPPLTTMAVDATAIGEEAAGRLLARMAADGRSMPPFEIRVPATVRLRRSCGCGTPQSDPDAQEGG